MTAMRRRLLAAVASTTTTRTLVLGAETAPTSSSTAGRTYVGDEYATAAAIATRAVLRKGATAGAITWRAVVFSVDPITGELVASSISPPQVAAAGAGIYTADGLALDVQPYDYLGLTSDTAYAPLTTPPPLGDLTLYFASAVSALDDRLDSTAAFMGGHYIVGAAPALALYT